MSVDAGIGTTSELRWNEARHRITCDACGRDIPRGTRYGIDVNTQTRYGSLCGCGIRHEMPDRIPFRIRENRMEALVHGRWTVLVKGLPQNAHGFVIEHWRDVRWTNDTSGTFQPFKR